MTDPLYTFVYASSAKTLFTDQELEVLLAEARESNRVDRAEFQKLNEGSVPARPLLRSFLESVR